MTSNGEILRDSASSSELDSWGSDSPGSLRYPTDGTISSYSSSTITPTDPIYWIKDEIAENTPKKETVIDKPNPTIKDLFEFIKNPKDKKWIMVNIIKDKKEEKEYELPF